MMRGRRRIRLALVAIAAAAVVGLVSVEAYGANRPVLGSASFAGRYGEGWGTARPAKIYNGGDLNGMVKEIQWTSWGGRAAIGYGLEWTFKPTGGYYERPLLVELRAQSLGHCRSQRAYRQLAIRGPEKPEGPLGSWHLWSEAKSLCGFGF
jgi:hypothetical protein